PEASFIMPWIFQTEHPLPRSPKVSELQELIQTLQQMKEHIHAVTYASGSSASDVHEAKIEATLTSSLAIYSLLQSLQEQAQKDMELLVLLIVTSTGYQVESSTFQHLLGHPEIQYMAKEMEAAHAEYVNLKEQDVDRAEAFLLLTGLTVTPESQELSPEQKRERLVFMEDHMKGMWSSRIKNLLQKHSGDEDWERLEQDLGSLIIGCLDDKWDEQRMQNILRDLEDTLPTPEISTQSQSKSESRESKVNEAMANQEFLQLLKRLGLESHYPRKMGMGDFRTICKTSLQDSQPSQDTELPFYFLQKLLTVDYRVRYLTCWERSNPGLARAPQTIQQEHQESDSFEKFLDKLIEAGPERASRDSHVHPVSSLKDRIGDLWNALLNENFVFSFKNSLEIAVYRKLETAFSQWTWRLRSHILDVQMRLDNKIRNGDLQSVTIKQLEGLVRETSDAIEKEVEKYFREDKDCEILIKWKSSTELKLKELKKTLLHETKKKCENFIELQKEHKKLVARKLDYEDELLRRSQELAVSLKGKSLTERELEDNFTLVWNKWIAEVSRAARPQEWVDIDAEIEDVLGEHFKEPGICARIRSYPKDKLFYLDPEKHIMKKRYLGYFCILRYLAEQENFEYFKQYLTSPKQFFEAYIETRVRNHCLDGSRRLGMFLDSSLNLLYRSILSAVSSSTQIVKDRKDREDKISLWLNEFCRELSEVINLPRSDLKGIEHQEVTDIEFLSRAMTEALDDLRDRLVNKLADADLSSFPRQPHTILAEHFSGCWEHCPFCGAICTNTMWNHDGDHQLVFHRPQALKGWRWYGTDQLVTDICSSNVASDGSFRVNDNEEIPYKRYRDAGPPYSTWNILPDSTMQACWKWFVSHFRTQLEALYNGKFQGRGEIPEAWQRITKQEALSELEKR
ncbi:LOW QUALITY PROTEIN: interferon-induced very large GTPase 1-like, partial [Passer montanus]|uniref:LOW QUALITY PROTEIN: interferon-induced very large GTPase 1-like n=1 Tax=Passer montanus TaxID=9160 RepID=UPI0019618D0D